MNREGASLNSNFDIKIVGSESQLSTGHVVMGNQHFRMTSPAQNSAVLVDQYAQASVVDNSLIDWRMSQTGAYARPPFFVNTGKNSIRKDNKVSYMEFDGEGSVSASSYPYQFDEGEVPVSHGSGSQSVYVAFASDFTSQNIIPKVQDIHINFVGGSSNSAIVYSIWGLSNLGFNITFKPVDGSSRSNGVFCWRVSLQ